MRKLLLVEIVIALSLIFQIYFLRLCKDILGIEDKDPRFKNMVHLIYLNFGIYSFFIFLLFIELMKK
ncbi:hypothetical protein BBF96_03035 [Anoxybacter fermentans]|uniref:Uncharacterized protein n=1 Tax=Anoxybacter fermentans TaxID=1323375 RepID=A0A3Q9HP73_9FIRM|nr:hypothetical protein BBF96_03035 [Anoxybacter fermentans]